MSLQHRIMIVLRGSLEPLTSAGVAHILGVTPNAVSSPLTKLCAYGKAEVARTEPRTGRRGFHKIIYYRSKPSRDPGYEEWRDQQYGKDCGP